MKKILMRSSVNPLEAVSNAEAITKDVMNGNIGNMVFASGIARVLLTDDCELDVTKTSKNFTKAEIDRINAEYDSFVIPLANAFRPNFEDELDNMSRLIKKLKIPCIVIGVGVQAKAGEVIDHDFEFDKASRRFIKTVLEKSAMIGVRGEVTAAYMKRLGFAEERDFTVIGCPSMYIHGEKLPFKEPLELTERSRVSVNRKINIPAKLHQFIYDSSCRFEDAMFVPQGIDDLKLLFAGRFIDRKAFPKIHSTYPWRIDSEICAANKEIGFTNVPRWTEFLRERDFSFGSRIHGNIMAVLSGTPAYIFAPDSRVLELAEYHNIQHMMAKDIKESTDIFDIYEKADFSSVKQGHQQRFYHYLDFLEANGLVHVFGTERKNLRTKYDEILEAQEFPQPVKPLPFQTVTEQADHLQAYYEFMNQQYGSIKNLERYAKFEKKFTSMLDKTPRGLKKAIKSSIKKAVD